MRAASEHFLKATRARLGHTAGITCLLALMVVPRWAAMIPPTRTTCKLRAYKSRNRAGRPETESGGEHQ